MRISTTTSLSNVSAAKDASACLAALNRLFEAGFKYLDFNLPYELSMAPKRKEHFFLSDDWRAWCFTVRDYCEKHGACFVQAHNMVHNYFAPDADSSGKNVLVDRSLEITARLGGKISIMHPMAPPGKEYDTQACLAANRDFFRQKAELAAKWGLQIAIENLFSTRLFNGDIIKRYCSNSAELVELVEAIDMENVGICVDTGHMHLSGEPHGEGIRRCGKRLIALHIHDNDTFNDEHLMPYCGTIVWDECYAALRDIKYGNFFNLEVLHACEKLPPDIQMGFLKQIYTLSEWMTKQIEEEAYAQ